MCIYTIGVFTLTFTFNCWLHKIEWNFMYNALTLLPQTVIEIRIEMIKRYTCELLKGTLVVVVVTTALGLFSLPTQHGGIRTKKMQYLLHMHILNIYIGNIFFNHRRMHCSVFFPTANYRSFALEINLSINCYSAQCRNTDVSCLMFYKYKIFALSPLLACT